MKKIIGLFVLLVLLSTPSWAFLYDDVQFLTEEEITKLSDKELRKIYIDSKAIKNASDLFHVSAGFSKPEEYKDAQRLIKLLLYLRLEMEKREGLDPKKIDDNMK